MRFNSQPQWLRLHVQDKTIELRLPPEPDIAQVEHYLDALKAFADQQGQRLARLPSMSLTTGPIGQRN